MDVVITPRMVGDVVAGMDGKDGHCGTMQRPRKREQKVDLTLSVPASKSLAQRAIFAAAMAPRGRVSRISGVDMSGDTEAMIGAVQRLGAKVVVRGRECRVSGAWPLELDEVREVNVGESGLCARLIGPMLAMCAENVILTGEKTLLERDMSSLIMTLRSMGAQIKRLGDESSKLPIQICGGDMMPPKIVVDGRVSSQVVSGVLMARPFMPNDTEIEVQGLVSKPYVSMTEGVMASFIDKESGVYQNCDFEIEGDWSGAAPFLVMGAIGGAMEVRNLHPNSLQADRILLEILERVGAVITWQNDAVRVECDEKYRLHAFEANAVNCPDLFPVLAALAAFCRGTSRIEGVNRLLTKESNRACTIMAELRKFGVEVKVEDDCMVIAGGVGESEVVEVECHGDHRVAMMCSVMGLFCGSKVMVRGGECVAKSYPEYWNDFSKIANCEIL